MANQANNDSASFRDIFNAFSMKVKQTITGSDITVPNPIGRIKDKMGEREAKVPIGVQSAKHLVQEAEARLKVAKKATKFWESWAYQISEMRALAKEVKEVAVNPVLDDLITEQADRYEEVYNLALSDYNDSMSK